MRKKFSIEYIKNEALKREDICLSDRYDGYTSKILFQCKYGHKFEMQWRCYFNQRYGCQYCAGNARKTIEEIKKEALKRGDICLSNEYNNARTPLLFQCKYEHEPFKMSWDNYRRGKRCKCCFRERISKITSSKAEQEIQKFIHEFFNIPFLCNVRNIIYNPNTGWPLEFDIWIPQLNKAIEYNGSYWHSIPYRKQLDEIKKQQCKEKGIKLLIIEEKDWKNNKETCKERIRNFIGNNENGY